MSSCLYVWWFDVLLYGFALQHVLQRLRCILFLLDNLTWQKRLSQNQGWFFYSRRQGSSMYRNISHWSPHSWKASIKPKGHQPLKSQKNKTKTIKMNYFVFFAFSPWFLFISDQTVNNRFPFLAFIFLR